MEKILYYPSHRVKVNKLFTVYMEFVKIFRFKIKTDLLKLYPYIANGPCRRMCPYSVSVSMEVNNIISRKPLFIHLMYNTVCRYMVLL